MSDDFKTLEGVLRLTSMRHGVLSSNIANADTPGYQAMDLKFDKVLEAVTVGMRTTSPRHIGTAMGGGSVEVKAEESKPWEDGNNVELDMEMAKMTENALLYQAGVTMLSTKVRMYKSALRRQ